MGQVTVVFDTNVLISGLGFGGSPKECIDLVTLDVFDEELSTDRSKLEYLLVTRAWYAFVKRRKYAKYNPLSEAGEEFDWEAS